MTREEVVKSRVLDTTEFWEWVVTRRVTDTPRGDFINDTRSLWNAKKVILTKWQLLSITVPMKHVPKDSTWHGSI